MPLLMQPPVRRWSQAHEKCRAGEEVYHDCKYEKDTETLMKLVGLSEQEASDWAYLASEVINWEWMLQILKAAEWGGTPQEAVEVIRAAIFVDEGIKVTVESEK